MEVADLVVKLRADSSDLKRGFSEAERGASSLKTSFGGIGTALAGLGIGAAIGSVAKLGVQFLSLKEQAHIAFTTMLGSGQAATQFLKELADFAARTPFEFPELITAAQRLKAMGFEAHEVIPTLTAVGDAVAAMGGNAEMINRITIALTQMVAKGKVSAEEMRQLAEAGIPAWQILADKLGITVPEAMKKAEKGLIDGRTAVNLLTEGIEKGTKNTQAFGGMMELKSKSVEGMASTLKDLGRQALGDILLPAFEKLRGFLAQVIEVLPQAVKWFQSLSPEIKNGAIALAAVAAIAPAVVGAISLLGIALAAMLSPIGLVVAAVGALAVAYTTNLGGIRDAVNTFASGVKEFWDNWGKDILRITKDIWEIGVKPIIGGALETIATAFRTTGNIMRGDWHGLWKDMIGETEDGIIGMLQAAIRLIEKFDPAQMIGAKVGAAIRNAFRDNPVGPKKVGDDFGPDVIIGHGITRVLNDIPAAIATAAEKAVPAAKAAGTKIGGSMAKGVGGALKEDGFAVVQDWLRSVGNQLDISKKTWDTLGKTVKDSLRAQAKAYEDDQVSVQRWSAVLLSILGKVGQEVVKLANGHLLVRDSTIQLNSHMDAVAQKMEHAIIPISHVDLVSQKMAHTLLNLGPAAETVSTQVLDAFQEMGQQIPQTWNHIIDAIIIGNKPLTDSMLQMGIKVKGIFSDVFQVIGNLPGKIGDTLRKITSDFDRWVNTINGILSILHRIFNSIPESLSHVAASIAGIFSTSHKTIQTSANLTQDEIQKTAKAASQGLDEVSESLQKSADDAGGAAAKWIGAIGAVMGAVAVFAGTRGQGKLAGILGGAAAGAAIGSLFGGLGAAIGAGVGALVGLLGSGKSAAQKQSEAAAVAAAKLSAEETGQRIIGTYFDNFGKALDFMSRVNEFEGVAKDKYRSFMRWFGKLLTGFVDTMKAFANENMVKAKEMAEAIGPIIQAIAAAPLAFDAINQHFGITEASIDRYFTSFDKVLTAFFARSEVWIEGVSKRAMKVADRLNPVVALISGFAGSFTSISEMKEPTDEMFSIFDRVLEKIVTHVEALSAKFDKSVLKTMANFAEKAGSALSIWKEAVDTFKSMIDLHVPTQADFDNLFHGIESAINGMIGVADKIKTEGLTKAQAIASSSLAIFAAIKAGIEALAGLHDYKAIASEAFEAVATDFARALDWMAGMIDQSARFIGLAITFEENMKVGAAHLASAMEIFAVAIKNLGFGLAPFGVTVSGNFSAGMGAMSQSSAMGSMSTSSVDNRIIINGNVVSNDPADNEKLRRLLESWGQGGVKRLVSQNG